VEGRSHGEVVADIKSLVGEVRLLVIDAATDEYCSANGIKVSSASFTDIQTIVCPDAGPDISAGLLSTRLIPYLLFIIGPVFELDLSYCNVM